MFSLFDNSGVSSAASLPLGLGPRLNERKQRSGLRGILAGDREAERFSGPGWRKDRFLGPLELSKEDGENVSDGLRGTGCRRDLGLDSGGTSLPRAPPARVAM